MDFPYVLCFRNVVKPQERYLIEGKGKFNVKEELNSLPFDVTVKPDVLFPPILQDCRQYCNVHALIASSKLQRNLQVATISVLTNLLISVLS